MAAMSRNSLMRADRLTRRYCPLCIWLHAAKGRPTRKVVSFKILGAVYDLRGLTNKPHCTMLKP